jgi:hypothetical protein
MGSNSIQSSSAASRSHHCNHQQNREGVWREGNEIHTERYKLVCNQDEVWMYDKTNGTKTRVWGDPHVHTGDGNKYDFYEDNLTIDLPDGAKITFVPTEMENGVSFIDELHVMKGDDAYQVTGIHDGEPQFVDMEGKAGTLDGMQADGTVLRAGQELDDLYHSLDPNKEIPDGVLDGKGGKSLNETFDSDVETEQLLEALKNASGNIFALMLILHKIASKERISMMQDFGELTQQQMKADRDLKNHPVDEVNDPVTGKPTQAYKDKEKAYNNLDTKLKGAEFRLQNANSFVQQLSELITNMSKADNDAKMSFARNIKS